MGRRAASLFDVGRGFRAVERGAGRQIGVKFASVAPFAK